ncbi:MAG: hypothetical protein A2086_07035 [Spirochaetes bacterium GWD1_27_9]|nr:MAG: hypothetical protein A2Z98_15665 [Spirochaetes bacterium GWB1_27_13]OHD26402.1 MAG: hypothetical protein A2Y34_14890 [Spirochaetes bacterium GWC1_27_15]OHD44451.1 MAG: hypothetical protein A2086_07035 [Spirochaetes bacterium GWD1_27_9]
MKNTSKIIIFILILIELVIILNGSSNCGGGGDSGPTSKELKSNIIIYQPSFIGDFSSWGTGYKLTIETKVDLYKNETVESTETSIIESDISLEKKSFDGVSISIPTLSNITKFGQPIYTKSKTVLFNENTNYTLRIYITIKVLNSNLSSFNFEKTIALSENYSFSPIIKGDANNPSIELIVPTDSNDESENSGPIIISFLNHKYFKY